MSRDINQRKWIKSFIIGVLLVAAIASQGCAAFKETGNDSLASNGAATGQAAGEPSQSPSRADETVKSGQTPAVHTTPSAEVTLSASGIPAYSGSPYTSVNNNIPAFAETDLSDVSYEYYSELDHLGRCGVAHACIGTDLMPTEERGSIGQVKPSGWQTVKYDIVDGKYLYNRCHLIGYQLSGENANTKNLITGTRYLNVDGMLPFENMVADYVKETGNHVLYRVSPIYEGDNLLASGVQMEAMSVEDKGAGVLFNVYCYNVQPGIAINYATGGSSLENASVQAAAPESEVPAQNTAPTDAAPVQVQQQEPTQNADIGTTVHITDTGEKYHNAGCQYLKKSDHTVSLSDAKARGLTPCSRCNPPQ